MTADFAYQVLVVPPVGQWILPLLTHPGKRFPKVLYITRFLRFVFLLQSLPAEAHNSNLNSSLIFTPCLDLNICATAHYPSVNRLIEIKSFRYLQLPWNWMNWCPSVHHFIHLHHFKRRIWFFFSECGTGTPLKPVDEFFCDSTDVIDPSMSVRHLQSYVKRIRNPGTCSTSSLT